MQLVPLAREHALPLWEASKDPEIWTYMPTKIGSGTQMEAFVEEALTGQAKGLELPFVVVDAASEEVIGSTRLLNISVPNRHLEIGWTWYSPKVWRSPVNTESKYLLLRHSFEVLKAVRVQICVDARNQRSRSAVLRIGGVLEGVLRRHRILSDGFIRDTCVYSIVDSEWPVIEQRLSYFLDGKYGN